MLPWSDCWTSATSSFWRRKPDTVRKSRKRLMAERRKIFAAYLGRLVRDFNQLVGIGKLMIVYSTQDRQEFARHLWRQQVRFYAGVCSVRIQLALYPLGWTAADAASFGARPLTAMRNQVQVLASPATASSDWP